MMRGLITRLRRSTARKRDEAGVYAILFAVLTLALMMTAALTVDVAAQITSKHQLQDQLDAAAQAGAFELGTVGSAGNAVNAALDFANKNGADSTLSFDFWCIVAEKTVNGVIGANSRQIPAVCDPGNTSPGPWPKDKTYNWTPLAVACSATLCAIPCNKDDPTADCNAIRVSSVRDVPFVFGPDGGIVQGHTGAVLSVACKGACGSVAPNPLDIAFMADRTGSMTTTNLNNLIAGMKSTLSVLNPASQYVTVGALGRSATQNRSTAACTANNPPNGQGLTWPSSSATVGQYMPVLFSNNYLDANNLPDPTSNLVKAINCLTNQTGGTAGTRLASGMKAAARFLLNKANDSNIYTAGPLLPARTGRIRKILIFETDGQPNETGTFNAGDLSLDNAADPVSGNDILVDDGAPIQSGPSNGFVQSTATRNKAGCTLVPPVTGTNCAVTDVYQSNVSTSMMTSTLNTSVIAAGEQACSNMIQVADAAKAAGILVITIGYNLSTVLCGDTNTAIPPTVSTLSNQTGVVISNVAFSGNPNAQQMNNCRTGPVGGPYTLTPATCTLGTMTITQTLSTATLNVHAYHSGDNDTVLDSIASAASPVGGTPSHADSNCGTPAQQDAENNDGDYFFCALGGASANDMAEIFTTGLAQASGGIRLMNLP